MAADPLFLALRSRDMAQLLKVVGVLLCVLVLDGGRLGLVGHGSTLLERTEAALAGRLLATTTVGRTFGGQQRGWEWARRSREVHGVAGTWTHGLPGTPAGMAAGLHTGEGAGPCARRQERAPAIPAGQAGQRPDGGRE